MMCERALSRTTQGETLARKQLVQAMIADSWIQLEQFRLLVLRTAWRIDKYNDYQKVRADISAVKAAMPRVLHDVASRALQIHGSLGVSHEMPFASMVLESFHMGLADGATEVHQIDPRPPAAQGAPGDDRAVPERPPARASGGGAGAVRRRARRRRPLSRASTGQSGTTTARPSTLPACSASSASSARLNGNVCTRLAIRPGLGEGDDLDQLGDRAPVGRAHRHLVGQAEVAARHRAAAGADDGDVTERPDDGGRRAPAWRRCRRSRGRARRLVRRSRREPRPPSSRSARSEPRRRARPPAATPPGRASTPTMRAGGHRRSSCTARCPRPPPAPSTTTLDPGTSRCDPLADHPVRRERGVGERRRLPRLEVGQAARGDGPTGTTISGARPPSRPSPPTSGPTTVGPLAVVLRTAQAVVAHAAAPRAVDHDRLPDLEPAHPGAELLDPPGVLVAERERRVERQHARLEDVDQVDVGVADPGAADAHEHLARSRRRLVDLGDLGRHASTRPAGRPSSRRPRRRLRPLRRGRRSAAACFAALGRPLRAPTLPRSAAVRRSSRRRARPTTAGGRRRSARCRGRSPGTW